MRAFHENPNRIHTELTFINPVKCTITKCMFLSSTKLFDTSKIYIMDPDQTAPVGAV